MSGRYPKSNGKCRYEGCKNPTLKDRNICKDHHNLEQREYARKNYRKEKKEEPKEKWIILPPSLEPNVLPKHNYDSLVHVRI